MLWLEIVYLKREFFVIIKFFPLLTVHDTFMFFRPIFPGVTSTCIPLNL